MTLHLNPITATLASKNWLVASAALAVRSGGEGGRREREGEREGKSQEERIFKEGVIVGLVIIQTTSSLISYSNQILTSDSLCILITSCIKNVMSS